MENIRLQAWLNEKFAPDLLPHHSEIVDCMMEQLTVMQHNVDRARKADLKVSIHKMEVGQPNDFEASLSLLMKDVES